MTKPILDAADAVSSAEAFVWALEILTRPRNGVFADPGDNAAVAIICHAALDKLEEAKALLEAARSGVEVDHAPA